MRKEGTEIGTGRINIRAVKNGNVIGSCTVPVAEGMQVTIGRAPENDIVIPSQYVGRKHCVLAFSNGLWYAKNLSSNGSFVNGRNAQDFTPVRRGDRLRLLTGANEIEIQISTQENKGQGRTRVPNLELLVVDSLNHTSQHHLDRSADKRLRFGRSTDNDIVIDSPAVSAHHGFIEMVGGRCFLYDMGSTNGVWINGSCYTGQYASREINAGDIIKIDSGVNPSAPGAMILVTESGGEWHRYRLDPGKRTVIGRAEGSDIRLKHVGVSRHHAEISYDSRAGRFQIENFGTNGTLLNGAILRGRAYLGNRSTIQITNNSLYLCGDILHYYQAEGGVRLEAKGLTRDVRNHGAAKRILDNVNLTIEPGEFVAIIGGSGCGKSTLLNALTGYEKATKGTVLVGDKSLYHNYDYFKSIIGFVPQQDIVYDFLELNRMLDYTAKLRMPKDTGKEEREARIKAVLDMVELSEFSTSMVKKLSGGQRKRASIAVELLADPGLFFLDEPTSGLDPGTERKLMTTLRSLSTDKRKTVIMVTHTTQNLHMCDKIIVMGKGGKLCFCGKPEEALRFFGVDNFVDIYNLVADQADRWHSAFERSAKRAPSAAEAFTFGSTQRPSFFKQTAILAARYLNLICNDRARLMLMLIEPVLMGLILYVCKPENAYESYVDTKNLLFTYVCCAIWIGIFNSVQEVCKERAILKREYMANLRLSAYICSKFEVQSLLCLVQSLLLFGVFAVFVGLPEEGIFMDTPAPEMLLTTYLTILSAACMGLAVSSVANNPDRAMTLSPFLLVIQLVFAGIIFALDGVVELVSNVTISRWSISALGVSADLEGMYEEFSSKQMLMAGGVDEASEKTAEMFEHVESNAIECWLVLLAFCLIFCVVSALLLRNISKDSR